MRGEEYALGRLALSRMVSGCLEDIEAWFSRLTNNHTDMLSSIHEMSDLHIRPRRDYPNMFAAECAVEVELVIPLSHLCFPSAFCTSRLEEGPRQ